MGVVVRRYIDFLILLIPTPLVSVIFYSSIPTFVHFKNVFYSVVTPAHKLLVFYLHDVISFVQVLRFFREDDWSALLPSTVDFRGTDQIQAVRQPFVVPLESSL